MTREVKTATFERKDFEYYTVNRSGYSTRSRVKERWDWVNLIWKVYETRDMRRLVYFRNLTNNVRRVVWDVYLRIRNESVKS